MKRRGIVPWGALLLLVATLGCHSWPNPTGGKSPLQPAQMSSTACALDILTVHCPTNEAETLQELWGEIDEQRFSVETRRRLSENGFRVGVVGTHPPEKLSKLLELKDKPVTSGAASQITSTDLQKENRVYTSHKQLPAYGKSMLICSPTYDEIPILVRDSRGLSGQVYSQAQGVLNVQAFPESDGRVRICVVPMLQHGQAKPQPVFDPGGGLPRVEVRQSRRQFDDLAFEASLHSGDMIVVSCHPTMSGSLGNRFFGRANDNAREQKLLVIRLAQTQHETLFHPEEALPLVDEKPTPSQTPNAATTSP